MLEYPEAPIGFPEQSQQVVSAPVSPLEPRLVRVRGFCRIGFYDTLSKDKLCKGFDPIIAVNPPTGKLDLEIFAELSKG